MWGAWCNCSRWQGWFTASVSHFNEGVRYICWRNYSFINNNTRTASTVHIVTKILISTKTSTETKHWNPLPCRRIERNGYLITCEGWQDDQPSNPARGTHPRLRINISFSAMLQHFPIRKWRSIQEWTWISPKYIMNIFDVHCLPTSFLEWNIGWNRLKYAGIYSTLKRGAVVVLYFFEVRRGDVTVVIILPWRGWAVVKLSFLSFILATVYHQEIFEWFHPQLLLHLKNHSPSLRTFPDQKIGENSDFCTRTQTCVWVKLNINKGTWHLVRRSSFVQRI